MRAVAGSEEFGWVWSDERGLHLPDHYNICRFNNYNMIGGTRYVLAQRRFLECVSVLVIQMDRLPQWVTAHHIDTFDQLDIALSSKFAYVASKTGLEVRSLPDFTLVQMWPGAFKAVSVVPAERETVHVLNRAGTVSILYQDEGRWHPSTYAVHAEDALPDHRMFTAYPGPWCPQHKHRLRTDLPETTLQVICDGLVPTYVTYSPDDLQYRLFRGTMLLWRFSAQAVRLQDNGNLALVKRDHVQIWSPKWWGCRFALLSLAQLPLSLILDLKKIMSL